MDKSHLVGVHEAGIAHHIAAVGEVNGQHGPAAVLDGTRAVVVQRFIVVGGNIAAGEVLLDPGQKLRVDGHDVLVMAVDGAVLHHPDLAITLDDVGLDLADLLREEGLPILLAVQNL